MIGKKTIIEMLTQDSVRIKIQKYIEMDGQEYEISSPHRKEYLNNEKDRQEVETELLEAQKNAIFAVWGDTPTVTE